MLGSPLTRVLALPKSHSLSACVSVFTSRFCGLMSRWQMPMRCMWASALRVGEAGAGPAGQQQPPPPRLAAGNQWRHAAPGLAGAPRRGAQRPRAAARCCVLLRAAPPLRPQRAPAHLVGVQLDEDDGHALVVLGVGLADAVDGVRHVLQHQVQVRLVLLRVAVEVVLELDDVGVVQQLHDLQLAVLEALVLQHLLDGHLRVARAWRAGEAGVVGEGGRGGPAAWRWRARGALLLLLLLLLLLPLPLLPAGASWAHRRRRRRARCPSSRLRAGPLQLLANAKPVHSCSSSSRSSHCRRRQLPGFATRHATRWRAADRARRGRAHCRTRRGPRRAPGAAAPAAAARAGGWQPPLTVSPVSKQVAWNTTPKEPLPTTRSVE
jgi:hypothetical protein